EADRLFRRLRGVDERGEELERLARHVHQPVAQEAQILRPVDGFHLAQRRLQRLNARRQLVREPARERRKELALHPADPLQRAEERGQERADGFEHDSVVAFARHRVHRGDHVMDYGLFTMPSHPPERALFDGHQWDLQTLRWADELGFSEAWIGEHHTAPWEPHPAPDLLVAQALLQTKRMRIGPGGFLLPYHHPAELANRVAMLDHLAQGRLNFGVAASGLPSDWAMFNVDGNAGVNREMTRESL